MLTSGASPVCRRAGAGFVRPDRRTLPALLLDQGGDCQLGAEVERVLEASGGAPLSSQLYITYAFGILEPSWEGCAFSVSITFSAKGEGPEAWASSRAWWGSSKHGPMERGELVGPIKTHSNSWPVSCQGGSEGRRAKLLEDSLHRPISEQRFSGRTADAFPSASPDE